MNEASKLNEMLEKLPQKCTNHVLDLYIQTTLWVVHSSVVEKLSVVDKTLPPNNFYLVKAPSSGKLSVVDKKIWDFYEILLFTGMHKFITI